MYLADYHTHSSVSHDGRLSMAELAEDYIAAGFDEVCFTDHVDIVDWRTGERYPDFHWDEMRRQFREAQETAGDRIRLRLGMELGDAEWDTDHAKTLTAPAPRLDFVIGSAHMLSEKFGSVDMIGFFPESEAEARAAVLDSLGQNLKLARWGQFSVLGHLSLSLRYFRDQRGFPVTLDGFEAEVEEIFRTLIQNGCGIEVNTNRGGEPLPSAKWLKLYRALGGEIITLGSDAHGPHHIGCAIRENQALLKDCGFKRFCTFEKMQPVWHEL